MYYISGNAETRKVKINNKILSPEHSIKVFPHSPDGFSWGYAGSGCAQLALAILLTVTSEEDATKLHQDFKAEFVEKWKQDKNFSHKVPVKRWLLKHGAKYTPTEVDFRPYDTANEVVGRACGDQCTKAQSKECNCSCGGANHSTEAVKSTTQPVVGFPKPSKKQEAVVAQE